MNRIFTLSQAAELLQISERTLWNLAKAGDVPAFRIGAQWRFLEGRLLEWAHESSEIEGKVRKQ